MCSCSHPFASCSSGIVIRGWLGKKQFKDLKNKESFELTPGPHKVHTHIKIFYITDIFCSFVS